MIPTTWWEDLLTWWESGTWEDRPFLGAMPKSLAWVILARRVLPFVLGFFFFFFFLFLPFLGAMPNPSLGCFLLVGCCLSCLGSFFFCFLFFAFFGGDAKSLAWVFLARRVLPAEKLTTFSGQKKPCQTNPYYTCFLRLIPRLL